MTMIKMDLKIQALETKKTKFMKKLKNKINKFNEKLVTSNNVF